MLALSGDPPPVGVNVTAIVQLELGNAVVPQLPLPVTAKSPAFGPLMLSLTGSENADRLVTVASFVLVGIRDVNVP